MHVLLPLLLWLAQPFWEAKGPAQWDDSEIEELLSNSPWARSVGGDYPVLFYLATARPIEEAETEARVRSKVAPRDVDPDYSYFVTQNRESHFVLAIPYSNPPKFGQAADLKKFEEESLMIAGGRKFKMSGHFPPTVGDPVLRVVFPREVRPSDKKVVFRLYLPGKIFPDREVEFSVKELIYHGRLEM
jgi:hypothetical protein